MDNRPFYYRVRGRTLGPVSLRQIRQLAQRAQVGRTTDISRDGVQWGKAGDWPEIFQVQAGAEPGPPGGFGGDLGMAIAESPMPAPAVAQENWYYAVGGVQQGPVPLATLQQMVAAGQLSRGDHVFPDGGTEWLMVSNVPQLSGGPGVPASPPQVGFAGGGNRAFCRACGASVHEQAVICPQCGVATGGQTVSPSGGLGGSRTGDRKDKTVAALLALLLGGLGAHHFYLGNAGLGVMYLLFCWTLIPAIAALIEAIMFLTMSDEVFNAKYNS